MIGLNKDKYFQVRAQLPPVEKVGLLDFLKTNVDVFAWSAYKALGIDLKFWGCTKKATTPTLLKGACRDNKGRREQT